MIDSKHSCCGNRSSAPVERNELRSKRLVMVFLSGTVAFSLLAGSLGKHDVSIPLSTVPNGLSVLMPVPIDNPMTSSKIELGRHLFFEQALSRDGSMSCSSCHQPEKAFADGREQSVGVGNRVGRRNAPSLLNAAYRTGLFWDGRTKSLEEQALLPITNRNELDSELSMVISRLEDSENYRRRFHDAFGSGEITIKRMAMAIAAFERTLVSGNSRYDQYRTARHDAVLSDAELRGIKLFKGKARCAFCHEEPMFTDNQFHNTGVSWVEENNPDLGKFEWTKKDLDRGKFKTPSLRNVSLTAPYMHDGSLSSMSDVINFYDRGGRRNSHQDRTIKPLNLSRQEKGDLLSFLQTLDGDPFSYSSR